jgi:biotin carboxyl carrier protein
MNDMEKNEKLGYLNIDTSLYQTRISSKFEKRKHYEIPDPGKINSFIPGTVLEIFIAPGQSVSKGQDLMILDAMKMKNRLKCPVDGKVKSVLVKTGDRVSKGKLLIELE